MVSDWIHAARPRTLPLAFSGPLMGSLFALADKHFNAWVCIFSILTTLFLQILSNFANDYGDYMNGSDNEKRIGPKRALQSGMITPAQMKIGITVVAILAFISGFILIFWATENIKLTHQFIFLLLGIMAIGSAIKYTVGKNPYGYKGWGDVFVLFFFGLVSTVGTYYLHNPQLHYSIILPAFSLGLLSTGVLNINNIRDYYTDSANNKLTLVVKLGINKAKYYHAFLIITAILLAFLFVFIQFHSTTQFLFIISIPFFIRNIIKVFYVENLSDLNIELKNLALTTFLFSILLGIGHII